VPFILNRLPEDVLLRVRLIVLLGPRHTADFQFHITSWIGKSEQNALPVLPEVERLRGKKILCFYGSDDEDAICKSLTPEIAEVVTLKGGHRIGTDFEGIAETILREAK